ncbi:MAG: 5'-methylthioadenosine/S-adenosylhomocysteine nucleosidase, partial [Candidatus Methanomethylophilus sp.]|nr:5'-methylthioadenosine/S-adenosylhomocysteine nucleosidase [Methanomethylophilus sp.]
MKSYEVLTVVLVAVLATAGCVHLADTMGNSSEPERIGIIGAMDEEVSSLKESMQVDRKVTVESMEFYLGKLGGHNVAVVQCGMGKVNAGTCALILITQFNARAVINTGVAGSLDPALGLGDFVVSVDAVQHDFDVSPIGFEKGEIPYTGKYAF